MEPQRREQADNPSWRPLRDLRERAVLTWCGTGQRIQATAQPLQETSLRQLREGASRNAGRLEVARTYQARPLARGRGSRPFRLCSWPDGGLMRRMMSISTDIPNPLAALLGSELPGERGTASRIEVRRAAPGHSTRTISGKPSDPRRLLGVSTPMKRLLLPIGARSDWMVLRSGCGIWHGPVGSSQGSEAN